MSILSRVCIHHVSAYTYQGAAPREWTQHFALSDGQPHCIYCGALHAPQPDSPFCSEACAAAFSCAASQGSARRQLFERDRGVCQQCQFDAHSLFLRIAALQSPQATHAQQHAHCYMLLHARRRE